jgi:hypothetical protein
MNKLEMIADHETSGIKQRSRIVSLLLTIRTVQRDHWKIERVVRKIPRIHLILELVACVAVFVTRTWWWFIEL